MKHIGVGHWACSPRERELVNEVLDSGRLSYGPKSKEYERKFAALHGRQYGVLSNSGTSSLQVALQTMKELHGWNDGDEVIVPAVTFVATANIVIHNRMKPVLVDVDPITYNISADKIAPACTYKTRAVIPVNLFGQPANMSEVWAKTPIGLKLIEDSCEAMFATHNGKMVGSMSDIGCFSMYVAHLITTGVGGIAITNNPDYAAKMRSLVNHGRDGVYIDMDTSASEEVISRRFRFESIGHSFRITELEAALGLAQLETWEDMIAARQHNARYLIDNLWELHLSGFIQLPTTGEGNTNAHMMFPIVLLHGDKWGLCNYLEERGIETREMLPLTNQPVYKGLWNPADYPVAEWINENGFYVSCHNGLTQEDLDYIVESFYGYFKKN